MNGDRTQQDLLRDDVVCREAFRRGERWAMERICQTYCSLVRNVVVHGGGGFSGFSHPADQDDAEEETWSAALSDQARLGYDGIGPYSRYLRGVARNVCLRIVRREDKFRRGVEHHGADPETPEEHVISQQRAAILRTYVGTLDARQRELFELRYARGCSERDLARRLGWSRHKTRKALQRLQRNTERYLAGHGIGRS